MKASVPISLKVIFVSLTCFALGVGGIIFVALDFQKSEVQSKSQETNGELAEVLSREISMEMRSATDEMNSLIRVFADSKAGDAQGKISKYLQDQKLLLSFGVYGADQKDGYAEILYASNQDSLGDLQISQSDLDTKLLPSVIKSALQHTGSVTVINTSPLINKPVITLSYIKDKRLFRSEIKTNNFLNLFIHHEGLGIYLVDELGNIFLSNGKKPSDSGSFRASKGSGFGLSVVVDSDESLVNRSKDHFKFRALLVTVMALGVAFIFAYLFSGQFTSQLMSLYKALEKIMAGHFDLSHEVQSHDELGTLSLAFKKLAARLQERERLKSTLAKFSKPEEIEKILTGETRLPIEKKSMTILICELHSGLAGSLGAEETIKDVNSFWSEVSHAITKYLGFIDKSNGTFIRAVWGALAQFNDEGASALSAALEIRRAIKIVNEKRAVVSLQPFKLGIGIHTGEVVAGHIGLEGRAEYTFVGDGALYAAKISAATREVKADILISDETYDLIKNKGFSFGPALSLPNFNNIKVHQIVGRKTHDGMTESDLSTSEQETILKREAVPLIYSEPSTNSQNGFDISAGTNSVTNIQTPSLISGFVLPQSAPTVVLEEPQWYLMRNPQSGVTEGPFTVNDLRTLSEQPGFVATQSYSFRYGDTMMVPLLQVPGVSRREGRTQIPPLGMPLPPEQIQAGARSEDWYVQREDGQIYGPYSFSQLSGYLETGHITRNTFCWCQGMATWLYAYQVPGLDRRQNGPPSPPIPIPKVS